jgi:ribosomal protein S25
LLWLYILLGIVLFIALVMFIPITLRASYKEEFWCAVYIGFVKLQLVPAKPKKEKKKKKAKKQTQKTEQPKKATEKKPSLIKKYGIEWLLNLIKKVAELAVSALQDFFSHILVKKLSLSISVAGDDAADTAIKYGKYCAVIYPAVGTIVRVVKCKGYGVDINPNFSEISSACAIRENSTDAPFANKIASIAPRIFSTAITAPPHFHCFRPRQPVAKALRFYPQSYEQRHFHRCHQF